MKLKFPNVPAILRGWIKAAFLRFCWQHELTGTAYDPEAFAKTMLLKRLELDEKAGIEAIIDCDHNSPSRIILDFFAHLALEGAENYREFQLRWRAMKEGKEDIDAVVIVQRRFGLSPHQAREKAERELREYKQRTNALLEEGSAKIEELRAERDEHARIATGLAIDHLGECRAAREKLSNTMLATCQANGELGTATVEALCHIDALEDLIQHWHVYLNYRGAAPEKLTEQQRELFAEVWRKHNEKVDAEEAAGK